MPPTEASRAICIRAHAGLVRARALKWMRDNVPAENFDVPPQFWWAQGEAALDQNWVTGDFETWINRKIRLRAYGVVFRRGDIFAMLGIPDDEDRPEEQSNSAPPEAVAKGGRPRADWWEDLLIEIAAQLYSGELKPTKQADIEKAMLQWIEDSRFSAADSTVRPRARKLMQCINKKG